MVMKQTMTKKITITATMMPKVTTSILVPQRQAVYFNNNNNNLIFLFGKISEDSGVNQTKRTFVTKENGI